MGIRKMVIYLAVTLALHSVWYREVLVHKTEKSAGVFFAKRHTAMQFLKLNWELKVHPSLDLTNEHCKTIFVH